MFSINVLCSQRAVQVLARCFIVLKFGNDYATNYAQLLILICMHLSV